MKLQLRHSLMAAAAAAALALAGCSASGGSAAGPSDSTLTLGTITPVTTFDAANASWANESPYMQAVYDTLLHASPNGTIEPWLATSWSYNAAETVLTMKLRNDVVFSDGTKFTAEAAAENILRFRDGTSPQKAYLASVKDAKAVNATTLEIDLSQPNPSLLSFLTQNCGLMESPRISAARQRRAFLTAPARTCLTSRTLLSAPRTCSPRTRGTGVPRASSGTPSW